ncbi:hypothetical protein ABMY20_02825 [Tenacibaculum sp. SSH1-16]|uniref:hypothetical protein n=1 Tax=Tenacibaculum sp. SSH1-16 TaxID=3136667 RepID=UPI0032C48EE3
MSFLKAKPLPHEIVDYPITQFAEDLQPNKPEKTQEANDEYFVLNMARGFSLFKIYTFFVGGGGAFIIILNSVYNKETYPITCLFNSLTFYYHRFISFSGILLQPT